MEDNKTKQMEDQKKKQEEASAELEAYFNKTRPRNLVEGVSGGVGTILQGAVGGVGAVVLTPVMGTAAGWEKGGILGSAVGLVGGAVMGVVGGVMVVTGGVLKGTSDIIRGVVSMPASISAPMKGKWWNDIDGKWVETNLDKESETIAVLPDDDKDIIGERANEKVELVAEKFYDSRNVKDPFYYEALGVATDADNAKIKRHYYLLARQYHPDKVGGDDKEALVKFKDISEAYSVLSEPKLRKIYDRDGKSGLSADKTGVAHLDNQPDPTILFAFLFGSDSFDDYIGRLAVATSALVGNDISLKDARKLQVRRCTRIALKLAVKLECWVNGDIDYATTVWESEAEELSKSSFGRELVVLIGQVCSLSATQFLGSLDSGVGMPSISKWTDGKLAKAKKNKAAGKVQVDTIKTAVNSMQASKSAEAAMAKATTEEEKKAIAEVLVKEQFSAMLQIMWTITAVDVTSTLHEACQMVFFDKAVEKSVLKKRAEGVQKFGEIFMACPEVEKESDPTKLYEEAAFAAMLETVKMKEDSAFTARFSVAK